MVTVHREDGLRFVIYTDDHEPAHVHVVGDGTAKIDIAGGVPVLVRANGMKGGDLRRAMRIAGEQRDTFLARWSELHG